MKIEEVGSINNSAFSGLEAKTKVRVAAVVKTIDDKETPYGTAKRFRGEVALELGDTVYTSRSAFFPTAIRDAILSELKKIGKWDTFEFALTAVKTADSSWSVSFDTLPRNQQPRAIALLED